MSFIKKLILFIYLCNENMLDVKVEKKSEFILWIRMPFIKEF
jgi:hypothetical protein